MKSRSQTPGVSESIDMISGTCLATLWEDGWTRVYMHSGDGRTGEIRLGKC